MDTFQEIDRWDLMEYFTDEDSNDECRQDVVHYVLISLVMIEAFIIFVFALYTCRGCRQGNENDENISESAL